MSPLLAMLVLLAPRASAAAEPADARLGSVAGVVTLMADDAGEKGARAVKGLPLMTGDRLVVGEDSYAEVLIAGRGILHLSPGSDLWVTRLDESRTRLNLKSGALVGRLDPPLDGRVFEVGGARSVAGVKGGEFAVEISKGEDAVAAFDGGAIEVNAARGSISLPPNRETTAAGDGPPAAPSEPRRLARRGRLARGLPARWAKLAAAWKPMSARERADLRRKMLKDDRNPERR